MGRYRIIRGVASASGGVLPEVSMDATDIVLAEISPPGGAAVIRHDVNPAYLEAVDDYTLYGRDRARGRLITAQRPTVAKIAAEPLFKNMPAINCLANVGAGGCDLTMDDYWRDNANFTFVAVATIDPVLKASPRSARLMSIVTQNPVATLITLGLTSGGNLSVGGFGGSASILSGSVPAANVPFVVWGQYSFGDNLFRIGINNSTIVDDGAPSSTPDFTTADRIGIGSPTDVTTSDSAWHGKIARATTFTSNMSASYLTTVIEALQNKYIA